MVGAITKRPRYQLGFPWRTPFGRLPEMEELMSTFWGNGGEGWMSETMVPSADVSETEKAIDVRLDLPGVEPEQIEVQVNGNLLTISGERKEEKEEKGRTFHRIERSEGSFSRTITLPCEVQENKVVASFKNGVLNVSLPKALEAKPHKIMVTKN